MLVNSVIDKTECKLENFLSITVKRWKSKQRYIAHVNTKYFNVTIIML